MVCQMSPFLTVGLSAARFKDAPKTWDQYLNLLRTLKTSGVQPMNVAKGRTNPGHNYSVYLMGLIGKDGFEDLLYRVRKMEISDRPARG